MRRPHAERQAVQGVDVPPRRVVVQALAAAHGLPRGRDGARRPKGHEHVERRQGWDGAARGYAAREDLEEPLDEAMEHTVCFGDAGGDGDAYEICCSEPADGDAGWVDAACLRKHYREKLVFRRTWTYTPSLRATSFAFSDAVLGGIFRLGCDVGC